MSKARERRGAQPRRIERDWTFVPEAEDEPRKLRPHIGCLNRSLRERTLAGLQHFRREHRRIRLKIACKRYDEPLPEGTVRILVWSEPRAPM